MSDHSANEFEVAVETTPAPERFTPEVDPGERIFHVLTAHGVPEATARAVLPELEELDADVAEMKAAECLRRVFDRLRGTNAGEALLWAVRGDESETVREVAARCGVSHPAVVNARAKTAGRMRGVTKSHLGDI